MAANRDPTFLFPALSARDSASSLDVNLKHFFDASITKAIRLDCGDASGKLGKVQLDEPARSILPELAMAQVLHGRKTHLESRLLRRPADESIT